MCLSYSGSVCKINGKILVSFESSLQSAELLLINLANEDTKWEQDLTLI